MNRDSVIKIILELLHAFSKSLSLASLYSPDHPLVSDSISKVTSIVHQSLSEISEISFILFNDDILFDGKPVSSDLHISYLVKQLKKTSVEHFVFKQNINDTSLQSFITLLHDHGDLSCFNGEDHGIRLGIVKLPDSVDEMIARFDDLSEDKLHEIQQFYNSMAHNGKIDIRQISSLVAGFISAFRTGCNPLLALVPLRRMDEYTFTHCMNVSILNIAQGMSIGISGELLCDIALAGMLHDAGKIFIDLNVLQKPGFLNEDEFNVMKKHPVKGAQYLMGQEGIPKLAVMAAYEHHMRYDLAGYPPVGSGWQLNMCSQMTMISDTFDALRTKRVYKDPWDFPKTCGHMLTLAGSQLNRELTVNFLKVIDELGSDLPPGQFDDFAPAKSCYCE